MSTIVISLLFLVMVGVQFCSPGNKFEEHEADREVAGNPFGCLLNIIGLVIGLGTCITAAIYFSFTERWWYFLLLIPGYIVAGLTKKILCKITPTNKEAIARDEYYITMAVLKKEFGVFLIIVSYILYFIFK